MESYSIFSSSTNSASISCNNNFPFSLSHDHFDGSFDIKYDHHLDHQGSEQSEPLISTTKMIQNDHHQQYESSMLESQTLIMSDYHHDNDQTADDDSERKITVNKNDDNISNKGKKGLLSSSSSSEKKIKKHRYAFQTRSPVDILDDGFRWRKYGQKAVKNNKFPRSYYRCTQQGCNVKKQVQRLSKDEEVVVTTYEGMHSHSIMDSSNTDNFEHILSQMQIYSSF